MKYQKKELISIMKKSTSYKDACKKFAKKFGSSEDSANSTFHYHKIKRGDYFKSKCSPWTTKEEDIVLKYMNNGNFNLDLSAELCGKELGRTKNAILSRWYSRIKYKKAAFINVGSKGASNVKNQARGTEVPDTPNTFSFMINGMSVESASISNLSINF